MMGLKKMILLSEKIIFFIQVKDSIRFVAVTGVQTCALPISLRLEKDQIDQLAGEVGRAAIGVEGRQVRGEERRRDPTLLQRSRSEERRVGNVRVRGWTPGLDFTYSLPAPDKHQPLTLTADKT